jgi:hypothetical protein
MFDHVFPTEKNPMKRKAPPDFLPPAKMAKLNPAHLGAVKRRFMEVYVRKPPPLTNLPTSGRFSRLDAIRGTYKRVFGILLKYERKDFHSRYLHLYPMQGIAKNLRHLEPSLQAPLRQILINLADKYELDEKEKLQIITTMNEDERAEDGEDNV